MAGYWMGVLLHEIAYERKLRGHEMTMASEFLRSKDGFNLDADREPAGVEYQFLEEVQGPPIKVTRTVNGKPVSSSVNQGIDATLDERGKRYGSYMEKAYIIQEMKAILRTGSSWEKMDPDMKESLDNVISKIGRIATGDPEYTDNWHDIIGYTKLVEDRLKGVAR